MNVTLDDLKQNVRIIVDDDVCSDGQDVFSYGTSSIFTLYESNVVSIIAVTVNGSTAGVTYTYNSTLNQLTVTSSLTYGDSVLIYYNYYPKYSDGEIRNKLRAAVFYLISRSYFNFSILESTNTIVPEPSYRERYLISAIAAILLEPNNIEYSLPDVKIKLPNNTLTVEEKIGQLISSYKKDNGGIFGLVGGPSDERC